MMEAEGARLDLPEGWVWTKFGDVSRLNFRNPEIGNLPEDLIVTFLPMAAVDSEKGIITKPEERTLAQVKKGFKFFSEGDVLFAKITPSMENGKAAIAHDLVNGRGFGSTEFHVISPKEGILSEWLFYFIRQQKFRQDAKANFSGTAGQLRVPASFIRNYPLPIAPLPEQRRIVARIEQLFSRLDAGVEALQRASAQLQRYRQAVLMAAVVGKLTKEWRRSQEHKLKPSHLLLNRILKEHHQKKMVIWKEVAKMDLSGLPELPESWIWVRLDCLARLKGGLTKASNRKMRNGRKVPYLRVANVQRGYLDLTEIKKIEAEEATISKLKLESGDLLFTEGGDRDKLGRGWIWQGELQECIYQNHIFRARLYSNEISNKFISWFSNTVGQEYFIREGKQTTNLASINLTKLSALPIPLPSKEEQWKIVSIVDQFLSIADRIDQMIDKGLKVASQLRQSILEKAFDGKLVPQDINDESAEKLLERIAINKIQLTKLKIGTKRKAKNLRESGDRKRKIRNIYDILMNSGNKLLPINEVWTLSGLNIEEFYSRLNIEINNGRIKEHKSIDKDIFLGINNEIR